ncbi:MAG: hypothetical protein EZS28_040981 [Streblomastix strix]|uniref:Uncharacterized protein n=1 Tax=Streblomastix strix TaxID=222440 RepID=A0A5J4U0F4_9EUKA|nr:MAG: hypothetical protein EZS28_040981 [Streblomastix strix]
MIGVPNWQIQSWWVDLQKITVKQLIVGRCADVLVPGGRMRKLKRHLLSGGLLICKVQDNRGDEINAQVAKQSELNEKISKVQFKDSIQYAADIVIDQDRF